MIPPLLLEEDKLIGTDDAVDDLPSIGIDIDSVNCGSASEASVIFLLFNGEDSESWIGRDSRRLLIFSKSLSQHFLSVVPKKALAANFNVLLAIVHTYLRYISVYQV